VAGRDVDDRQAAALVGNMPMSVPVRSLKSSAARCCALPLPDEA
jgi:hypothetical protein